MASRMAAGPGASVALLGDAANAFAGATDRQPWSCARRFFGPEVCALHCAQHQLLAAQHQLLTTQHQLLGQSEELLVSCFSLCRVSATLSVLSLPWDEPASGQRRASAL